MSDVRQRRKLEFSSSPSLSVPGNPYSLVAADFDGDGSFDLAAGTTDVVAVFWGDGHGHFNGPLVLMAATVSAPRDLFVDRQPSGPSRLFVVMAGEGVFAFRGRNDRAFDTIDRFPWASAATGIASGDFDEDGVKDIVTGSGPGKAVSLFLCKADGGFRSGSALELVGEASSVVAMDFNHDSHLDLAVGGYAPHGVNILYGVGDGTFNPGELLWPADSASTLYQLRGVGEQLITGLLIARNGGLLALWGDGQGHVSQTRDYPIVMNEYSWAPVQADLDDDGLQDVIVAVGNDSVAMLLGRAGDDFEAPRFFSAGHRPVSIAAADFDGNGLPDLAIANYLDSELSILLNSSD